MFTKLEFSPRSTVSISVEVVDMGAVPAESGSSLHGLGHAMS